WDPEGCVRVTVAPTSDVLVATAQASNQPGSSGSFRWADEWDEEEDETMAADEGFHERCSRLLVRNALEESR
ncbi:hypothetical protein CYMTET_44066, partial [Cymbomonas tetramitiformis]